MQVEKQESFHFSFQSSIIKQTAIERGLTQWKRENGKTNQRDQFLSIRQTGYPTTKRQNTKLNKSENVFVDFCSTLFNRQSISWFRPISIAFYINTHMETKTHSSTSYIPLRHIGHTAFSFSSQGSIHSEWKKWPHRNSLRRTPLSNSVKQIEHVGWLSMNWRWLQITKMQE